VSWGQAASNRRAASDAYDYVTETPGDYVRQGTNAAEEWALDRGNVRTAITVGFVGGLATAAVMMATDPFELVPSLVPGGRAARGTARLAEAAADAAGAARKWWDETIGAATLSKSEHMVPPDLDVPSNKARATIAEGGAVWNNGWRSADGKFSSPEGSGLPGAVAEGQVWDAVSQKPGWQVTRGRIYVTDSTGQIRVYDGMATSPNGRNVGLEIKSGDARKTAPQREFDNRLNSNRDNKAVGTGEHEGIVIDRSIEVNR